MSDNYDKMKEIIIHKLGVDENKITKDAKFVDDLGADSLDTIEIIKDFEEEFDVEIPDEDAEQLTTIQSALDYIDSKLN